MATRARWSRQQLLVAFALYCRLPFGRLHQRNPEIARFAKALGRTPAALAMKLVNIASLDSSVTSTGRKGLQRAAAQDRLMWAEMETDWEAFAVAAHNAYLAAEATLASSTVGEVETSQRSGEHLAPRRVRIGQSFFRSALLGAYGGTCCITGLAKPALLVASHIKPWRVDARNRVNPRNGLLLSALHKAFDAGLITVAEDMTVRVSGELVETADRFLEDSVVAYHMRPLRLPGKFLPDPSLLAYHREFVFRG